MALETREFRVPFFSSVIIYLCLIMLLTDYFEWDMNLICLFKLLGLSLR